MIISPLKPLSRENESSLAAALRSSATHLSGLFEVVTKLFSVNSKEKVGDIAD